MLTDGYSRPSPVTLRDVLCGRHSFSSWRTYRRWLTEQRVIEARRIEGERWHREMTARYTPEELDFLCDVLFLRRDR